MSAQNEALYRRRLTDQPAMLAALDSAIPLNPLEDDSASHLTRQLLFSDTYLGSYHAGAFSRQLPFMADHGVRQAGLLAAVLSNENIRDRMPDWLQIRALGQAVIIADAGLTWVGDREVSDVYKYGPKHGHNYAAHPAYCLDMARSILDTTQDTNNPAGAFITAFAARHHYSQAKRPYGVDWGTIEAELTQNNDAFSLNTLHVDAAVAFLKPIDYFDDTFTRSSSMGKGSYEAQVCKPVMKFAEHIDGLLAGVYGSVLAKTAGQFDPELPLIIARTIPGIVLAGNPGSIDKAYRMARPDLLHNAPTVLRAA